MALERLLLLLFLPAAAFGSVRRLSRVRSLKHRPATMSKRMTNARIKPKARGWSPPMRSLLLLLLLLPPPPPAPGLLGEDEAVALAEGGARLAAAGGVAWALVVGYVGRAEREAPAEVEARVEGVRTSVPRYVGRAEREPAGEEARVEGERESAPEKEAPGELEARVEGVRESVEEGEALAGVEAVTAKDRDACAPLALGTVVRDASGEEDENTLEGEGAWEGEGTADAEEF